MDFGPIIQAALVTIIQVLLPVALGFLVAYINHKIKEVKSQVSATNLAFATNLVRELVRAAEQSGLTGALEKASQAKKQYVLDQAQKALEAHGITIDVDLLDALIEAAVNDAFGKIDFGLDEVPAKPA